MAAVGRERLPASARTWARSRALSDSKVILSPLAKETVNGLPGGKAPRQQAPGDSAFSHIEECIHNDSQVGARTPQLAGRGEKGFQDLPLGGGVRLVETSDPLLQ